MSLLLKPIFLSSKMRTAAKVLKIVTVMMALTLTIAAQEPTEVIDTAQLVAVYDYELKTQNDEGVPVTDKMQIVVQIGQKVTKSMPFSAYSKADVSLEQAIVASYQEALMHVPTVWRGLPLGQTTVREFIFPHEYESTEETPEIGWTLTEDTMTVSGYQCRQAKAIFRGVEWLAWYTDEIPSPAGPWRLGGLPGLIVQAESEVHRFNLSALRQETSLITMPDKNPEVHQLKYAKLLKYRNEIYGNSQYTKNPLYYISEFNGRVISLGGAINHLVVLEIGGQDYLLADDRPLLTKAHLYQPLEFCE